VPPHATITADVLADLIRQVTASAWFATVPHPAKPNGWDITWGAQIDPQIVTPTGGSQITDVSAASYLAKYATKSTEITGHVSKRITADTIAIYGNPAGSHTERLIHACWHLGKRDPNLRLSEQDTRPYKRLRTWAHMLGFGGHFLTQSARYFVTFTKLRQARVIWRRTQLDVLDEADQQTAEVTQKSELVYVGAGWHTTGDALLANTSAAMAREMRRVAKEELAAMAG
jgi:hypothetical protein